MIKNGNNRTFSNSIAATRAQNSAIARKNYASTAGQRQQNMFASQGELAPSQTSSVGKLIGNALDRNVISKEYHQGAYPSFLRSNGPFKVYDHATKKGTQYVANIQYINDQAQKRFQSELTNIKQVREFERKQFEKTKYQQDLVATHK